MTKKVLALLLDFLLIFSLWACGETEQKTTGTIDTQIEPEEETNPTQEEEPVIEFLEEMSIVSNEDITVKITGLDPDNYMGYTLKLFLENKTDKNLYFTMEDTSVNDVMCDPYWAIELSPGKKTNEEVVFSNTELKTVGIRDVNKIEFHMVSYDSEDWSADYLFNQQVTVYPWGEAAVTEYTRTPVENEIAVFDTEDCTMIITGVDPDDFWGYSVQVYMYNKTDKNLMFTADEGAVNDYDLDPFWATRVAAGKHAIANITWFEEDLAENGIDQVEKIFLEFRVSDADDWLGNDLIIEEIEFAPF